MKNKYRWNKNNKYSRLILQVKKQSIFFCQTIVSPIAVIYHRVDWRILDYVQKFLQLHIWLQNVVKSHFINDDTSVENKGSKHTVYVGLIWKKKKVKQLCQNDNYGLRKKTGTKWGLIILHVRMHRSYLNYYSFRYLTHKNFDFSA